MFCLDSLSVQSSLNSILLFLSREQKPSIEVKFMQQQKVQPLGVFAIWNSDYKYNGFLIYRLIRLQIQVITVYMYFNFVCKILSASNSWRTRLVSCNGGSNFILQYLWLSSTFQTFWEPHNMWVTDVCDRKNTAILYKQLVKIQGL